MAAKARSWGTRASRGGEGPVNLGQTKEGENAFGASRTSTAMTCCLMGAMSLEVPTARHE